MKTTGDLLKMLAQLKNPIEYKLPVGEELIPLNPLIGSTVAFHFKGIIHDIHDGSVIKKSYNQGYSYQNFIKLAACDMCILKPELCHYHKGTCREPEWGEKNCMVPHIVYLAVSSGVKVGITRETQIPTRWIDQGAAQALPILRVSTRQLSGLIEKEIAQKISDRTNWRQMLKGETPEVDLEELRDEIYEEYGQVLDDHEAEDLEEEVVSLNFPLKDPPPKLTSLSLDKVPTIKSKLLGIKGQYLVFEQGVLNIRKHQGYEVEFEC